MAIIKQAQPFTRHTHTHTHTPRSRNTHNASGAMGAPWDPASTPGFGVLCGRSGTNNGMPHLPRHGPALVTPDGC